MKSIPCSQSPNRIQRNDADSRNVPLFGSYCFLGADWWIPLPGTCWRFSPDTVVTGEPVKLNFGNEEERGTQINVGNAIGFSAAAEPPFRATHSHGKTRCSENDCLSELSCFENPLLTSQDDGLIALKCKNFLNSGSILQLTFPSRLQKILNQNRICHSLKQR